MATSFTVQKINLFTINYTSTLIDWMLPLNYHTPSLGIKPVGFRLILRGSNKVFKCYITDNQTKNMGGGDRLVGPWLLYRTPSWYPLLILRHLKFRCVDHIRSTYFFMVSDQKLLLNISIKQNNSILLLYKGFTWCVITLKPLLLFRMLKGVNIFIMCRQAKGFHYFQSICPE